MTIIAVASFRVSEFSIFHLNYVAVSLSLFCCCRCWTLTFEVTPNIRVRTRMSNFGERLCQQTVSYETRGTRSELHGSVIEDNAHFRAFQLPQTRLDSCLSASSAPIGYFNILVFPKKKKSRCVNFSGRATARGRLFALCFVLLVKPSYIVTAMNSFGSSVELLKKERRGKMGLPFFSMNNGVGVGPGRKNEIYEQFHEWYKDVQ